MIMWRLLMLLHAAAMLGTSLSHSPSIKTLLIPSLFDFQPMVLYINVDAPVRHLEQFCHFHAIHASRCHLLHEAVQSVVQLNGASSCRKPQASELPAFLMMKGLITRPKRGSTSSFAWMQDGVTNIAADLCHFLHSSIGDDAPNVESCMIPLANAFERSRDWINTLNLCAIDGKKEQITVQERHEVDDIGSVDSQSTDSVASIESSTEKIKSSTLSLEALTRRVETESTTVDYSVEKLPITGTQEQQVSTETMRTEYTTTTSVTVEVLEPPRTDDQVQEAVDNLPAGADVPSEVEQTEDKATRRVGITEIVAEQVTITETVQVVTEQQVMTQGADEVSSVEKDADVSAGEQLDDGEEQSTVGETEDVVAGQQVMTQVADEVSSIVEVTDVSSSDNGETFDETVVAQQVTARDADEVVFVDEVPNKGEKFRDDVKTIGETEGILAEQKVTPHDAEEVSSIEGNDVVPSEVKQASDDGAEQITIVETEAEQQVATLDAYEVSPSEENDDVPSNDEPISDDGEEGAKTEEALAEQYYGTKDADEVAATKTDTAYLDVSKWKRVKDMTSNWDKFSAAATLVVLFLIFYLTLDLAALALYEIQQGGMEVLTTGAGAVMHWWPKRMINAIRHVITWTAARYYAGSRRQQRAEAGELSPRSRIASLAASWKSFLPFERWQLGSGLKPLRHMRSTVYPSVGLDAVRARVTLMSPPLSPRSTVSTVGSTNGNHRIKSFSVAKMALLCGRFASHVAPQAKRHVANDTSSARVLKELDELVTEKRAVTALWDQLHGQELLQRVREGIAARRLQRWWRLLEREVVVEYTLDQEFTRMEGMDDTVSPKNEKMDNPSSRPSSPLLPPLQRRYSTSTA